MISITKALTFGGFERMADQPATKQFANERCPCCDREIKGFMDYPMMEILAVSIIKPEDVPEVIKRSNHETLVEKQRRRFFFFVDKTHDVVPAEVVQYFAAHPAEKEFSANDGCIYERYHFSAILGNKDADRTYWHRHANISNFVKQEVMNNASLREALSSLESMVGKTMPTKAFIKAFGQDPGRECDAKQISDRLYLLFGEDKPGDGFRTIAFSLGMAPMEMGRLHSEILYAVALDHLATVRYQGKMLK